VTRAPGDRPEPRQEPEPGRREGQPVVVEAGVELDRPRPTTAVLLSAFDILLWETRFGPRVLGFEHVIEMYKPAPQRRYGYYVRIRYR